MAGRNHLPPNALKLREMSFSRASHHGHPVLIEDPRAIHRLQIHPHESRPHPALVEERIAVQHRDIQTLLVDNQRLAATHVALKQELAVAQQELLHLSAATAEVKGDRDAQVREVYERSLKMEAEVRSIDALTPELAQVRADVQKLTASRQELAAKFQAIDGDLVRVRSDLQQLPAIKSEIEAMHQELQRGRAAVEYEKQTHASNLEQGQAMEKSMISMAREIEKLRAELANAEKRARAAAAAAAAATPSPGYAAGYGNPEMVYGGSSYPDPYTMHQVQGGVDAGSQYGSGTMVYDMQRNHLHR
ncbi:protein FLC EXPRESSOR [Cornus florida]|uniref:protein FLC EXPRESSOR n=1 Tax=Cornus florida TaxID=4283 RepID=UPI00289E98E6|nr:protein FLC EXPRESSOR [Cornus florida]